MGLVFVLINNLYSVTQFKLYLWNPSIHLSIQWPVVIYGYSRQSTLKWEHYKNVGASWGESQRVILAKVKK